MLSRMREAYDETGSTDKAIELGLARTGKLVTSGALILMFAFLVLSTSPGYEIKPLAIGIAAGIIFDATVIRALLVPALMKLSATPTGGCPDWTRIVLRSPSESPRHRSRPRTRSAPPWCGARPVGHSRAVSGDSEDVGLHRRRRRARRPQRRARARPRAPARPGARQRRAAQLRHARDARRPRPRRSGPGGPAHPRPRGARPLRRRSRDRRGRGRGGCSTAPSASPRRAARRSTRTVLLATGMLDEVPDIPGFAEVWGTSAHTCPYCDGFEHRDERLAVLAAGARGEHLAVLLRQWSNDVVLLSNGPHDLAADQLARVQALGVPIIETPVVALDSDDSGACAASGSATARRSTATRCSSTSAGSCAPSSPARWAASCATTAPSPSTPTRRRPSTASTPPATAPTPERWSRRPPAPAPRPPSPSTRA